MMNHEARARASIKGRGPHKVLFPVQDLHRNKEGTLSTNQNRESYAPLPNVIGEGVAKRAERSAVRLG